MNGQEYNTVLYCQKDVGLRAINIFITRTRQHYIEESINGLISLIVCAREVIIYKTCDGVRDGVLL